MTHNTHIRGHTQNAQTQYTFLCRIIEFLKNSGAWNPPLLQWANHAHQDIPLVPLYLVSADKAQAALDYARTPTPWESPLFARIEHLTPCIFADDESAVLVKRIERVSDVEVQVYSCLTASRDGSQIPAIDVDAPVVALSFGTTTFRSVEGITSQVLVRSDVQAFVFQYTGHGFEYMMASDDTPQHLELLSEDHRSHTRTALEQMAFTTKQRVVVVKDVPHVAKKHAKHKKLPRADVREVHVILDPDAVHEIRRYAQSEGTHASPKPHKRRAHVRVLRSERYKGARGKVVQIGESDINIRPGETIKTPRRIFHVVSVGGEYHDQ